MQHLQILKQVQLFFNEVCAGNPKDATGCTEVTDATGNIEVRDATGTIKVTYATGIMEVTNAISKQQRCNR